jgi:hypothetical protein
VSFLKKARKNIKYEQKRKDVLAEERRKRISQMEIQKKERKRLFKLEQETNERLRIERERLREEAYKVYFDNKEFINKNTNRLEDFLINNQLNRHDLEKLARLNETQIIIPRGWIDLVLELMVELAELGWKGEISKANSNYESLGLYAYLSKELLNIEYDDIYLAILEKYYIKANETCEVCGEYGEMDYSDAWEEILCKKHKDYPEILESTIALGKE